MMILMIAIGVSSVAFGQTKMSNDSKVEAQIIALEKAGWEAWKNKDTSWIQKNGTEETLVITSGGIMDRTQYIKDTLSCDIKSVSLADFKVVMLDKDAALMTYTAMQDGVCGGQKIPSQVRATVNYVKRGGKWLEAMYMETPMSGQNNMSGDMNNSSDGATEQALIANERAVWKTLTDGKFEAFANWLTEDYQGFYPDQMTNKTSEVDGASKTKFKRVDLSNFKVQMLDKDSAIVMYEINYDFTTPDGKDVTENRRQTSVYSNAAANGWSPINGLQNRKINLFQQWRQANKHTKVSSPVAANKPINKENKK